MSFADDHIAAITAALASIDDAADRARTAGDMLTHVPGLQRALREVRQEAVQAMRADGLSHADVAAELGISRSRAQGIAEGKTTAARKKAE
ncbi:hypothetical protein [Nocardiopsis sp. NPDC006938]|uniref:hypothetical protein n=1 Tax=Nocardiopsis sp. NPDC006938 TaxID=3364337 RepID=UPI00368E90D0